MNRGTLGSWVLLAALTLQGLGCGSRGDDAVLSADRLVHKGLWEEAALAYGTLPESAGAWRTYGAWRSATIYRDALNDPVRAEEAFRRCADLFAEDDWGYSCQVELGDLRLDEFRPRQAIAAYRASLEMRPSGAYAEHCQLQSGRAYLALGEYGQSRVEWGELLTQFPNSPFRPTVALESARSYDLEGRHKEALDAFQLVQQEFPGHSVAPLAALGEAESLEQLGRFDLAVSVYEKLRDKHPNPTAIEIKLEALKERKLRRDRPMTEVVERGRLLPPGATIDPH